MPIKYEGEMRLKPNCLFCRNTLPETKKECDKRRKKRIKANDPIAMYHLGVEKREIGHYTRAFEYFTKAAELGNVSAHFEVALMYRDGQGVEKNDGKKIYHLEEAAIGGEPNAT